MAGQKYVSWAAEDTREASTLPTDFDATITAFRFSKEPPPNYEVKGEPIFAHVTLLVDEASGAEWKDKSEAERTLVAYYTLGGKSGDEMTISEDGYGLIPNNDDITGIRGGCKFDMLKKTLEAEGVSKTITQGGDGSKLVGMKAHWRRIDDEKLLGKKREFEGKKEKKFPEQTLVVTKLLAMPGEKGATKTTTAAASTTTAAAAPTGTVDERAQSALLDVIANATDNTVQRAQLIGLITKQVMKDKDRSAIAKRGSDEEFLMKLASEGFIKYDPSANPQVVSFVA